ncbi:MAG: VOC family protein, partial [Gemmatimonadetes bacterium]|nr:VOC family protein [Gemmatimonadota bacterium]NIQ55343.1 VOC family protein [Gemmatimonadota bacterium]NIU75546.1 VOC family protein [Gammaproteobacteria bacterium]NIX45261.1 VOC family protein [Gemmatimonadota bacterium]NIY09525.1 VOC family protein [Gemmatimonadota bacterium]
MARVLGIGGVFFKCDDPARLAAWYREHLGLDVMDFGGALFRPAGMPPGSYTVWGPFPADTDYFAPSGRDFMINFIVDDVEG